MCGASHKALVVKNLPANAGDARDASSILGSGRSPGEGLGNPLQYSCLENPMDRGAWWASVHRVTKSQTQLKQLSMYPCTVYVYTGWRGKIFAKQEEYINSKRYKMKKYMGVWRWESRYDKIMMNRLPINVIK